MNPPTPSGRGENSQPRSLPRPPEDHPEFIPADHADAYQRIGAAVVEDLRETSDTTFLQAWWALCWLHPGLHPDDRGDRGVHEMTYSLRPHAGGFSVESVIRPAYELNMPPVAYPAARAAGPIASLVAVDAANVIVESVKWAEAGKAMVLRLYEAGKTGTPAVVRLAPAVRRVCETDMLEQAPRPLPLRHGRVKLYFRPFEIKTLRCEL